MLRGLPLPGMSGACRGALLRPSLHSTGPLAGARRLRAKAGAGRLPAETATDLSIAPRDDAIEFAKIEGMFTPKHVARHTPELMLHHSRVAELVGGEGEDDCSGLGCSHSSSRDQGPSDDDGDEEDQDQTNTSGSDEDSEDEESETDSGTVGVEDYDQDNQS